MEEKTEVFEKLKEKYAKTSQVSERTIKEVIENLVTILPKETSDDDFLVKADAFIKTIAGNVRKDVADYLKNIQKDKEPEIKDDKPNPKNEEGKNTEKPKDKNDNADLDMPAWAKVLYDQLGIVKGKLENEDKLKTAEKTKGDLFNKLNIYPKNVLEVASDGFDFSQENAETIFTEKVARTAGKFGIVPEKGSAEPGEPDFSAIKNRLKERGLIQTKN